MRRSRSRRGGALVGLVMMVVVVSVAALTLVRTLNDAARLRTVTDQMSAADEAARRVIERMHAVPFAEVFHRFNGSEDDDLGTGANPGASFAVDGLSPREGDADGMPGEILFPTASGTPGILSETASGFPGAPMDLNADGDATDADATPSHRILPVRVRVRWKGVAGDGQVDVATILTVVP